MSVTQAYSFGISVARKEMLLKGEDGVVRLIKLSPEFESMMNLEQLNIRWIASIALGHLDFAIAGDVNNAVVNNMRNNVQNFFEQDIEFDPIEGIATLEVNGVRMQMSFQEIEKGDMDSNLIGFRKTHLFFDVDPFNEQQIELYPGIAYNTHEFHH